MVCWIMWVCFKKKSKLGSLDQLFQDENYGPLNSILPCCSNVVLEKERFFKYFHSKMELHSKRGIWANTHNPNQPMIIVEFLTGLFLLIHEPVTCLSDSIQVCDVNTFWCAWDFYYKIFLLNSEPDFFYGDKLCHDLCSSNRPIVEVLLLCLPWAARCLGLWDHSLGYLWNTPPLSLRSCVAPALVTTSEVLSVCHLELQITEMRGESN